MKTLLLLIFTLLCMGRVWGRDLYFPPVSGETWDTLSPSALGWPDDGLNELYDFLDEKNSKAFIVLKDGKIVVEWYFDSFTQDSLWYWASAGKTITAFLVGLAKQEGLLKLEDKTSDYLGKGWTSCPSEKEDLITLRHQLTMTTGLDDRVADPYNTTPPSLQYRTDAGMRWAYHNAPYTLLGDVLEAASGMQKNLYTADRLSDRIGMKGLWLQSGFNSLYISDARSMARFGLLIQNRGVWDADTLLYDQSYFQSMITPSQDLNRSYGYLWWLNGQGSYMLPALQIVFKTDLFPNAPADLVAGLGKNDQKLYVLNSRGLVVVRLGENAGQPMLALSSFDNELWGRIMDLYSPTRTAGKKQIHLPDEFELLQNFPNPFNPSTTLSFHTSAPGHALLEVFNIKGEKVATLLNHRVDAGFHRVKFKANTLPSGVVLFRLTLDDRVSTIKGLKLD
jgi:CubicO group peptidase (beta-lactamase class C family)